jgi:mono/diheme cytochrome c family protein
MKYSLLALLILATGCNSRKEKGSDSDDSTTPIVSASEISFSIVNQNVFAKSCVTCHGNGQSQGGVNLDTYANAVLSAQQIKLDVDTGHMPKSPAPPLSQRQKDLIDLWVAQKAPNQAGGPGAPDRPPLTATFASIKESLLTPKCTTCHNPTGRAKDIKLDTAADLQTGQKILVVPGKPEASVLVKVISPGARRPMPPGNKPKLSDAEVAQISDWVAAGAVDDTAAGDASKFKAIQDNIIQPRCANCHTVEGSAEHVSLDSVRDLTGGGEPFVLAKDADNSWLLQILKPGVASMPPASSNIAPLTQEEWNVIKDWINAGANL